MSLGPAAVVAASTLLRDPPVASLGALSSACCRHAGLPEEVSHTKQALARGYAVLAIDSRDRRWDSRCYS